MHYKTMYHQYMYTHKVTEVVRVNIVRPNVIKQKLNLQGLCYYDGT
jgi:hypothetical protein